QMVRDRGRAGGSGAQMGPPRPPRRLSDAAGRQTARRDAARPALIPAAKNPHPLAALAALPRLRGGLRWGFLTQARRAAQLSLLVWRRAEHIDHAMTGAGAAQRFGLA